MIKKKKKKKDVNSDGKRNRDKHIAASRRASWTARVAAGWHQNFDNANRSSFFKQDAAVL